MSHTVDLLDESHAGCIKTAQQRQEVETLEKELMRLMERHKETLNQEGIHNQVKLLECWLDNYRKGLGAATKLSESGVSMLESVRDKLKLAADERLRLDNEGGTPPNREQAEETEELLKALRRLEHLIPTIEQLFNPPVKTAS